METSNQGTQVMASSAKSPMRTPVSESKIAAGAADVDRPEVNRVTIFLMGTIMMIVFILNTYLIYKFQ